MTKSQSATMTYQERVSGNLTFNKSLKCKQILSCSAGLALHTVCRPAEHVLSSMEYHKQLDNMFIIYDSLNYRHS